jgi:hypothetical protein
VIEFAGTAPSDDEIAAIVTALASAEPAAEAPAAPAVAPWKLAGRNYDAQDDRCLARF